jgi:hypothetical protein
MAGWMGGPASSKLSDVYESGIPLRCGTGLRLVFVDERWGNVENGIGRKLSMYYIPIYSCTHVLMSSRRMPPVVFSKTSPHLSLVEGVKCMSWKQGPLIV